MAITRLSVYDFDQTLFDSPMPERGKEIWKEKTGEEYPHVGWWGRKESLDTNVFDIKPYPSVLNQMKDDMTRGDTYTVLLTSRVERLRPEIEGILSSYDINPDEILLKQGGIEKNERVQSLIDKLPDVEEVNVYDDREKEFAVYRQLRDANPNILVNIYKVDNGKVNLIENFTSYYNINDESELAKILQEEIKKI